MDRRHFLLGGLAALTLPGCWYSLSGRGSFLPVTFHFQRAGDVEVNVFVQAFDRPIVTPVEALRPGGPAG